MPKRTSKRKRRKRLSQDVNKAAAQIVEITTGQPSPGKNPAAVALGRLGGLKGGKARFEKLPEERRRQIARDAARARWHPEESKV